MQTITVTDKMACRLTAVPTTYEIACDEYDETTLYAVMAADNCDSDVTITILSNRR